MFCSILSLSRLDFVFGKIAGARVAYVRIFSLVANDVFVALASKYPDMEFDTLLEVLTSSTVIDPNNPHHRVLEETTAELHPNSLLPPRAQIIIVPKYEELVFQFRTLNQDNSLRVLSEIIVGMKPSTPISGSTKRIDATDIEVTLRSYRRGVVQGVYQRFLANPLILPNGTSVSDISYSSSFSLSLLANVAS